MQGEDGHMSTEAKIQVVHRKPKNGKDAGKQQELEVREDSSRSLEREHGPADILSPELNNKFLMLHSFG